jgi:hypothetical protein
LSAQNGELDENARALALDAFIRIYFHRHVLKRGVDPKAHIISVINSIGANRLRAGENWLRAAHSLPEGTISNRQAELAGESNIHGEQIASAYGRRPAQGPRAKQIERAEILKATLPAEREFEAGLVDAIAVYGTRDRKKLAEALNTSVEKVRGGLSWLLEHVKEIRPEQAKAVQELAAAAVPPHTIA